MEHQPSWLHRFCSDIVHLRSRSKSPNTEHHQEVESSKALQRDNQAAVQRNKHLQLPPSTVVTAKINYPHPSRPSLVADQDAVESKSTGDREFILDESEIRDSKAFDLSRHANVVVHPPPDSNISGTAYEEAWLELSEDEREHLCQEDSIKTLFEKLDETDQENQSKTWFKRGKMAVGLRYVSSICSYVDLVTAFIPAPGLDAALSLFKGTVAIAIGIFGAYDGLTSHIRQFLEHIPIVERYDSVSWSSMDSLDIRSILINCYLTLLSFYSKVMAFLQQGNRIRQILETFHSQIPEIVTSFNGHAERLSKMVDVETSVMMNEIWNMDLDRFVEEKLYLLSQDHISSRNDEERKRSDEACRWIISEYAFEDWAYGFHGVLTMYGVVGCGKTATASYVAKYLSKEAANSPVLIYRCMQQEVDKHRLVLCSLTFQLLQKQARLKTKFKKWYDERKALSEGQPSNEPAVLAEFFCTALRDSTEQVFVVLDGLDECEQDVRRELLILFRDLIRHGALLKVFVSSRQLDDIQQILSGSMAAEKEETMTEPVPQIPLFHINMIPSEERDQVLAKHLAAQQIGQDLDSMVRQKAIDQLAKRAEGSAIWLKMAMESLADAETEDSINDYLDFLETSPAVVDWYQRLFKRVKRGPGLRVLERALETLAVARRPLSVDELSRVAIIEDSRYESLTLLNRAAAPSSLWKLIRPFVAISEESEDLRFLKVRLVHQSLLDLLLNAQPSEWYEMATTKPRQTTREEKEQRSRELNTRLMGGCVKYLLFDDLRETLSSKETSDAPEDNAEDIQEDDSGFGLAALYVDPEVQKRVEIQNLVSKLRFYDYAASNWAIHYAACEKTAPENLRNSARKVLDMPASGGTDWVSIIRVEKEAAVEAFPTSSEPVTLAAYYGLNTLLADIFAEPRTVLQSTKDEALFWASRQNHHHTVKMLLEIGAGANQRLLDGQTALTISAHRGHLECVRALLAERRTEINLGGRNGRTALSFAVCGGHEKICAVLLERTDCVPDEADFSGMTPLFYAIGPEHLALIRKLSACPGVDVNHREKAGRTALSWSAELGAIKSLKQLLGTEGIDVNLSDQEGKSPLIWAALKGQAACIDVLIQHPEFDKTAVHSKDKKNAWHYSCEVGEHKVLRCLAKHDFPGIDDPDIDGWTPLMWAISHGPHLVKILLATGQVDVGRRDLNGRTALFLAVQWKPLVETVRVLLEHGADPETTDNHGQTLLDEARQRESPKVANEIYWWINKQRSESITHLEST